VAQEKAKEQGALQLKAQEAELTNMRLKMEFQHELACLREQHRVAEEKRQAAEKEQEASEKAAAVAAQQQNDRLQGANGQVMPLPPLRLLMLLLLVRLQPQSLL
jgi:hypothetical protein